MNETLGMLGPITLSEYREFLHPGQWRDDLPRGLGGTPVNLLTRELLRRGRKVVLISLYHGVQDEIILEGENLRICIGPYRPKRARDFWAVERDFIRRTIAREKPDVLHAQWTYEYALAAHGSGLPHVITAHDAPINVLHHHDYIPFFIARTMMAYRVLSRARRVVSVSPYVAEHLRRYMLYRGKLEVVPNGMPEKLFEHKNKQCRESATTTFATILSNWGHLKNGEAAIEAFALHRQNFPENRLIMFGTGFGSGEIAEQWARERGFDHGIEFAGQTPYAQVIERLGTEVDVLVHPSREEAQPMVLIEAMAQGVPVIGGKNSGGVPWTLDDGRAGVLVDVNRPAEIAQAMMELSSSPDAIHEWGRKGKELAQKRFHISVIADAYEQIYEQLGGKS